MTYVVCADCASLFTEAEFAEHQAAVEEATREYFATRFPKRSRRRA